MECFKTQFPSEKVAQRVVASIRHMPGRKGKTNIPKRVYKCPFCKMWHITSSADGYDKQKRRE